MSCQSDLDIFLDLIFQFSAAPGHRSCQFDQKSDAGLAESHTRARGDIGFWYNKCLDNLCADLIRTSHDCNHAHCRVLHQAVLNLGRPDPIARTGDQVVLSSHEPEISVLIFFAQVSGEPPIIDVLFPGSVGVVPVLETHDRVPSGTFPNFFGR